MPASKRVFIRHGSYHYDLGRDETGKRRSTVLCRVTDGESELYAALARVTRPAATTVADLLDSFMVHGMKELSPTTQKDYRGYITRQLRKVFGDLDPADVETQHIAQYLEKRKEKARSVANKEIACLASAFQYGLRNGLCSHDPTKGVKRNKVRPKHRYVRHDEFETFLALAPEYLQDIMAGIYLMELRPHEARDLRRTSITPKGVLIEESKTDKVKLVEWSPSLQFFLTRATSRHPASPFVFTNSRGEKWTEWAMHSAMNRIRAQLPEGAASFTFHDLRAKGESDHANGGHGLLTLYKRTKVVRPVW